MLEQIRDNYINGFIKKLFSSLPIYFFTASLAVFAGFVASFGEIKYTIVFISFFVLLYFLFNYVALVLFVFIGGLVVTGLISLYFPQYSQIRWIFSLAGLMLFFVVFIHTIFERKKVPYDNYEIYIAQSFIALSFMSIAVNYDSFIGAVVGIKSYFQVWSILFVLYYLSFPGITEKRIIKAILLLSVLQLPFVLHQFFVLVPGRVANLSDTISSAYDIVVGTFTASYEGGGGNVILSILLIFSFSLVLMLYKNKIISLFFSLLFFVICILPITLNESKISFIFIPIAMTIIFWEAIKASPLYILLGTIIMVFMISVIFSIYSILPSAQGDKNLEDYFENVVAYNLGDRGYGFNILNRKTVLYFWLEERNNYPFHTILIGHGLGNSKSPQKGVFINTLSNRRYLGYGIGLTAVSSLLWDVGVVGLFLIILLYYRFFVLSFKLSNNSQVSCEFRSIYRAISVGISISFISLFFHDYFVFEIGFQTLTMFFFGITILGKKRIELISVKI